ncbi:hypothetical protein GCM10017596_02930 [Microbacterium keratanolyticum]|uniref:Uncharacterized protein n=1 Tax=Microbacterium keratanolyticum TaxID=67574 RepID=A0A9W6M7L7_9MICO|nr:hypothetical protein GCM10017596_02930 [Microbacterium keratanolyticum]
MIATATAVTPAADASVFGRARIHANDFTAGPPWAYVCLYLGRSHTRGLAPRVGARKLDSS